MARGSGLRGSSGVEAHLALAALRGAAFVLGPWARALSLEPAAERGEPSGRGQRPSSWPQFRNTPTLTGVAATTIPDAPKLLWTFDAGGAVESSAAIVDGTVYVASNFGELVALDLASGKPKWRYRAIGENLGIADSSPAVAGGTVYVGDLDGVLHAVDAATRQGALDLQDGRRDQVVAGRRRQSRADRLVRHAPSRRRRRQRQAAVEARHRELRPRDAGDLEWRRLLRRLRRVLSRRAAHRRRRGREDQRRRLQHRVVGDCQRHRLLGHLRQRGHRRGHRREEGALALHGCRPPVPVRVVRRRSRTR